FSRFEIGKTLPPRTNILRIQSYKTKTQTSQMITFDNVNPEKTESDSAHTQFSTMISFDKADALLYAIRQRNSISEILRNLKVKTSFGRPIR
ncbi:hypothetical protein PSI23_22315, partial [Xenorhabdus sp. XENO-10]